MRSKRFLGLVMSFVMAVTFCCPSLQVAAVGKLPEKHNAEVAAAKAFGWFGAAGVGAVSWLWRQKKAETKELVAQLKEANKALLALQPGKIPIPEGLNGEGIQLAIDFALGRVDPSDAHLHEKLQSAYSALFDLMQGVRAHLPETLKALGATVETMDGGRLSIHDVNGDPFMYSPPYQFNFYGWASESSSICSGLVNGSFISDPPGSLIGVTQTVAEVSVPSWFSRPGWVVLFQLFDDSWRPRNAAEAAQDIVYGYQALADYCLFFLQQLPRYMPVSGASNVHYPTPVDPTLEWNHANGAVSRNTAAPYNPLDVFGSDIKTPAKLLVTLLQGRGIRPIVPLLLSVSFYQNAAALQEV
ncbi:MAG: hypothetical protein LBJ38_01255 [Oscillospiraceae bacterium]|jgi:hypothetical protein|nr:hypothetical protein [Oscillospiraceae bacterium]